MRIKAALLAAGLAVLFAQAAGLAVVPPPNPLPFSTSYLLTGDYEVGSIDLKNPSAGIATGTIAMKGVPANADILAAFLYVEVISPDIGRAAAAGITFRGQPLTSVRVKAASKALTGDIAACFAGSAGAKMTMFRADVLRLLPPQKDKNGVPTGKLLVNDADLRASGLPLNTVTVPDAGGTRTPQGGGASLVVVYRDASLPLRKIVVHDGIYVEPPGGTTTQTIRGFYQSDATRKSAKITHIVGSRAKNPDVKLFFNDKHVKDDPFGGPSRPPGRAWSDFTADVSSKMPGTDANDGFGETVTTKVAHQKKTPYDCLSWAAT